MKKISIIYWSGTGNTQKMAEAIADGAKNDGNEVKLLSVDSAKKEDVLNSDVIAFGCPSMGCEELEESEMEPFISEMENENISGKKVALFGSYGWGDGQWMRDWEDRMKTAGVNLITEGLIINNTPDDVGIKLCRELGKKLSSI